MENSAFSQRTLFLVFIVCSLAGGSTAMSDSDRVSSLASIRGSRRQGLLPLDIPSFETFVETAPRSYHLFVMISADEALCKPCAPVRTHLEKLASDYENLPRNKQSSKPVFFAELKISGQDQEFLMKYGVQHVPLFYAFRAGDSQSFPTQLKEDSPNNYVIQKLGVGPNNLKQFVNSRSGSRMTIVRGGYQIPFVDTVRMFLPIILSIVAMAAGLAVITGAYKSPMLWFGVVVLVYIFSVGGGHYSWIHNTPLAVVNNDGVFEYIASGSRSQYVAEGFFVSVTCVSISVLVILIQELPAVLPNKAGQTIVGSFMVMMTVVAITALLVMYQFVSTILSSNVLLRSFFFEDMLTRRLLFYFPSLPPHRKCPNTFGTAKCSTGSRERSAI